MPLEKDSEAPPEHHEREHSPEYVATMVYVPMAFIGAMIGYYFHETSDFSLGNDARSIGFHTLVIALSTGVLLICDDLFGDLFPSFAEMHSSLTEILGECRGPTLLYLAVISGVAEEFLFRFALQPWIGIFFASFIFGLLHLGRSGRITTWTVWAFIASLFLGWLYDATGKILVPTTVHIVINGVGLLRWQREFRRAATQSQTDS